MHGKSNRPCASFFTIQLAMLTILLAMLEDEEDQRKFLKLHTAYEQKLYRIALKILRSHELAEDAVQ